MLFGDARGPHTAYDRATHDRIDILPKFTVNIAGHTRLRLLVHLHRCPRHHLRIREPPAHLRGQLTRPGARREGQVAAGAAGIYQDVEDCRAMVKKEPFPLRVKQL